MDPTPRNADTPSDPPEGSAPPSHPRPPRRMAEKPPTHLPDGPPPDAPPLPDAPPPPGARPPRRQRAEEETRLWSGEIPSVAPDQVLAGRYEIVRRLGRGGMGEVWLANDRKLQVQRALKFVPPAVTTNPRALKNLEQEACVTARLTHPHIVILYNLEQEPSGLLFLVYQYAPGVTIDGMPIGNLDDLLFLHERLGEDETRRLFVPICDAIHYAHTFRDETARHGIVHRDIKPANILLDASGAPLVSDFGIARTIQSSMSRLTGAGVASGTLPYMSPEQIRGRSCDGRADIYSLGMVIYEMLTGAPPFAEGQIEWRHMNDQVPPIAGVSGAMNTLIARATAKDPAERWQTCAQMSAVLAGKVPPSARPSSPRSTPSQASAVRPSRPGRTVALSAGLLVALVAVGLWGFSQGWLSGPRRADFAEEAPQHVEPATMSDASASVDETSARPLIAFSSPPPAVVPWAMAREFSVQYLYLGQVEDGGIRHYEWRLNDGDWQRHNALRLTLPPLAEGDHRLELVAVDGDGVRSATLSHAFSVVNQPPTIAWKDVFAADATVRAPPQRTVTVEASDPDGFPIAAYWFALDAESRAVSQASPEFRLPTDLAEGPHTLFAWAVDDGGAESPRLSRAFQFRHNTPPTVTLTGPDSPLAWGDRGQAAFTVSASDAESEVARIEYRLDGGAWQAARSGRNALSLTRAGDYRLEARAVDAYGLESQIASAAFTLRPGQPPTVSARLSASEITEGDTARLTVSASDPDGGPVQTRYQIGSGAARPLSGDSATLSGLSAGVHSIVVTAENEDGQTATDRLTLTVKPSGPQVGNPYTETASGMNMSMVWIPAGSFRMGSPTSESGRDSDEGPVRTVSLDGFWMGATEVTNGQYQAFLRDSGYDGAREADSDYLKHIRGDNNMPTGDDYPIVWVSWHNAQAFCAWLSRKTGKSYTLPTEAQWEYACRAGSTTRFSFGDSDSDLGAYGWYSGNSNRRTHPVGTKRPNGWGLYDMHGNVWEWCLDWFGDYPSTPQTNPTGPNTGSNRVLRGGSWHDYPHYCRSARRSWFSPAFTSLSSGFRVVVVPGG